jgi:hypothetical protein
MAELVQGDSEMKQEVVKIMVLLLLGIIVLVVAVVWASKLPGFNLPGYYTEKDRFIRYLSCAYALCAKGCGSTGVNMPLEVDKVGTPLDPSCDQLCKEMGGEGGTRKNPVHMCGEQYALEFEFQDDVNYNSNYWNGGTYNGQMYEGFVQSDIKDAWQTSILGKEDKCFSVTHAGDWIKIIATPTKLSSLYPDYSPLLSLYQLTPSESGTEIKLDPACSYLYEWGKITQINGMCEGTLRSLKSGSEGCKKGLTQSGSVSTQNWLGTGHLWIDVAITGQCKDFKAEEHTDYAQGRSTDTNYYASCEFNKKQKIYIWSDGSDQVDNVYCPELVVCSSEPTCISFKSASPKQLVDDAKYSSLVSFKDKLYLFYQHSNDIYYKTCGSNCDKLPSWSSAKQITDSQNVYTWPSAAVYNDNIYLAYSAGTQPYPYEPAGFELMLQRFDGSTWRKVSGTGFVRDGQITLDKYPFLTTDVDYQPSLVEYRDKLYIFWNHGDSSINYTTFDGMQLVKHKSLERDSSLISHGYDWDLGGDCGFVLEPSATVFNNKLYLVASCVGSGTYMKIFDGTSWSPTPAQQIGEASESPFVYAYKNKLYMFYSIPQSSSITYKVSSDGTDWKGCNIDPKISGTVPSFVTNGTNAFLSYSFKSGSGYDDPWRVNLIND